MADEQTRVAKIPGWSVGNFSTKHAVRRIDTEWWSCFIDHQTPPAVLGPLKGSVLGQSEARPPSPCNTPYHIFCAKVTNIPPWFFIRYATLVCRLPSPDHPRPWFVVCPKIKKRFATSIRTVLMYEQGTSTRTV